MARIRLAILMVFVLAVAGCGGDSGPLRPETAARQAQMTDEADVDPEGSTASTGLQNDTVIEEDALAEERQLVEGAISETRAEAQPGQADDEIAVQETQLRAAADFVPYVAVGGHVEFDGSDVRCTFPFMPEGIAWC